MIRIVWLCVLSFFCLICNAETCEANPLGSYAKLTHVHQSACQALLPDVISLCSDSNIRSGSSCSGRVIGTFQPYTDIQLSLENGRTANGNVFALCLGQQYVADFFVDSSSFRSNNVNDPLFTESRFCEITYLSTGNAARSEKMQKTPKNLMNRNADALTCDELFESGFSITTYQTGLNCLNSVPFSSGRRNDVLEYYRWFLELYAYRDLNINSGGDDPVQLDIFAELNRIERSVYSSDFDFQADMSLTFRKMRDSHTQFRNSRCYGVYNTFAFFQPFSLRSRVSTTGAQEIFISELEEGTELLYNFDVGSFRGFVVESIDGVDALQALIDFANAEMSDKDRSVRFNSLLFQDLFTFRNGIFSSIPQRETVTWRLRHPNTNDIIEISIAWLTLYFRNTELPPLQSTNEFIAECSMNLKRDVKQSETYFQHRMKRDIVKRDLNSEELVSLPDASLFRLDSTTGVIIVPDFSSSFDSFMDTLCILYFSAIHRYGFSKIEIDVSRNPGGTISYGYFLAALLEPELLDYLQHNDFDQIHAEIFTDAIDFYWNSLNNTGRAIFDEQTGGLGTVLLGRLLPGGIPANPQDSWYTPGVQYTRGGKTSTYSRMVELFPQEISDQDITITQSIINLAAYPRLPASKFLIVTDGTCASTCSFFVRTLRNAPDPVMIVGYGGLVGESLRTSQIPANIAFDSLLSEFFNQLAAFGMRSDAFPVPEKPLDSEDFTFALMEAYAEQPGNYYQGINAPFPIEFTPSPVDFRIFYWPDGIAVSGAGDDIWLLAQRFFIPSDIPYNPSNYAYWYPHRSETHQVEDPPVSSAACAPALVAAILIPIFLIILL